MGDKNFHARIARNPKLGMLSAMVPITFENLTKAFGSTVAVNDITMTIEPGELCFLLGPSGCGKTTLLRMIAGLIDPTRGKILFGDRNVTHLATGKRNCAMVFQSYALWPHMTVAQNVGFGLDVRKVSAAEKKKKVDEALSRVKMQSLGNRRPTQLSGGQQQRVALARALTVSPDVLLLDEPLSNLDAKLRMEMRSEIRRICKEAQITTVYVTHDQEEALSMADRIAVMHDGNLRQVGPPREIYERPMSRFVADFLGTTNFIPATVQQRDGDKLNLSSPAGNMASVVFPDDVPGKGNVTCSVRPEAMRLLDNGNSAENVISGRHVDTMYLGDLAQHTFAVNDDLTIEVTEIKPKPRDWSQEQIKIGFDPDEVVVLLD